MAAPTFTKCDPNNGSVEGLYQTTITGKGLGSVTNVRFGGRSARIDATTRSDTELKVTVPQRSKVEAVDLTFEYTHMNQKASKKIMNAFRYTQHIPFTQAQAQQRKKDVTRIEKEVGVSYFTTSKGATVITYSEKVGGGEIRCYLACTENPQFDNKQHLHVITGVEGMGGNLTDGQCIVYDRSLCQAEENAIQYWGGYKYWYKNRVTLHDMTNGGTEGNWDDAATNVIAAVQDPNINKLHHVICLNWCHSTTTYKDLVKAGHIK